MPPRRSTISSSPASTDTVHSNQDCQNYGGSFSVLHEKTGLFLNFGTGLKVDNLIRDTQRFSGTDVDEDQFFWAAQAGVEKKFNDLGKTTIYGEYYNYDGAGGTRRTVRAGDALNPTGDSATGPSGIRT